MNHCHSCFDHSWETIQHHLLPDKYERYCGIDDVDRIWARCLQCGHCQSSSNYDPERLMPVYIDGYRSERFRGLSIDEQFAKIIELPNHVRENHSRVNWVNQNLRVVNGAILDVGSGLGVFPFEMRQLGFDVVCTEINEDSKKFLGETLSFKCIGGDPGPNYFWSFGILSMVHVLEHTQAPGLFLNAYRKYLKKDGVIFIEVPDALEFDHLMKGNDEFNSCHLHFFTVPSLTAIVERSGYLVDKVERVYNKERDLYRIRLLGRRA